MAATLMAILPIFGLILVGWAARRSGVLGPQAGGELNRFVVWLALPALLFDIVAHARGADIWQPGFIGAFGLSCVLVFAATMALRWRGRARLADAALDALNAGYANTAFLGFPIVMAVIGREAMTAATIATLITVCALFAVAVVLIEVGLQSEPAPHRLALKVAVAVAKNPLVVAPAAGALFLLAGIAVPAPAEKALALLGSAASPCALVALGLFLGERRPAVAGTTRASSLLILAKLGAQPLVAWLLATSVFGLSPLLTRAAVLLAALPTGTGPFMLAEFYRREADVTARTVLISTIASVVTAPAWLALAQR